MKRLLPLAAPLALIGCSGGPTQKPAEATGLPAKITQFYAYPNPMPLGYKELKLCYGVESADSVALDPPIERVWPSAAKCVDIPTKAATYKLTVVGHDKKEVSQVVEVKIGPPLPPKMDFTDVVVNSMHVKPGDAVNFCFHAKNADKITGGPGKFMWNARPSADCLVDNPSKDTTYVLRLEGPGGQVETRSVTVEVP